MFHLFLCQRSFCTNIMKQCFTNESDVISLGKDNCCLAASCSYSNHVGFLEADGVVTYLSGSAQSDASHPHRSSWI